MFWYSFVLTFIFCYTPSQQAVEMSFHLLLAKGIETMENFRFPWGSTKNWQFVMVEIAGLRLLWLQFTFFWFSLFVLPILMSERLELTICFKLNLNFICHLKLTDHEISDVGVTPRFSDLFIDFKICWKKYWEKR